MDKFTRIENNVTPVSEVTRTKMMYDGGKGLVVSGNGTTEWVKTTDKVFVLPYMMYEASVVMYHSEVPAFASRIAVGKDGVEPMYITCIGNDITDTETTRDTVRRVLLDEAGLVMSDMIDIDVDGPYHPCVGSSDRYYLCLLNLGAGQYKFVTPTGKKRDGKSRAIKVDLGDINDIIAHDMVTKQLIDMLKIECNMK